MSTYTIDSARTNERLSAFKSEIGASSPIDNTFVEVPTTDHFMKNKKTVNGGRQIIYPIDSGRNQTVKWFSDYDIFDTTAQDTALTVGYPFVNIGGTIVISWEEMRETAGDDHRIFDLVAHKRNNCLRTIRDDINAAIFAAAQAANQITTLVVAVDSTGTTGGLAQGTDADWAAHETASGAFPAQGLDDMRTLYNDIRADGVRPSMIITTQAIHELYEAEIDPEVRYSTIQTGARGFKELEFKGVPIMFDDDCTANVLYMINNDHLFFVVDSAGNFDVSDFQTPVNQEVSVAKVKFRGNLVCNRREANGKLTGVTA